MSALQTTPQSLSVFPDELLRHIIAFLSSSPQTLGALLRCNKHIGHVAMETLYSSLEIDDLHNLFSSTLNRTLERSILNGAGYYQYHKFLKCFSMQWF